MTRVSTALVLVGLLLAVFLNAAAAPALASSGIDTSKAYSSGFVSLSSSGNSGAWYTWVNEGGVKLVFLALYSPVFNSPVFTVVGQEYNSSGSGPVFVGNALMMMEVFNDSNHNGVLDASNGQNASELKYTVIVNSSQSFVSTPVSQNESGGIRNLHWGVEYKGIDAFLIVPGGGGMSGYGGGEAAARLLLDHLGISYDYTITNRTATLQSKYDVGQFTVKPVYGSNESVSLQGLSLSVLFSTVTIALEDYSVATSSIGPGSQNLSGASIQVGNLTTFNYLFNDNYTLYRPQPAQYRAVVALAPPDSLPLSTASNSWFSPLGRIQYYQQSLPMYSGLPSASDLNYSQSKFFYRLTLDEWSGHAFVEDPTFVAYLGGAKLPLGQASIPFLVVVAAAVSGSAFAALAIVDAVRRRRSVRIAHVCGA